MATKLRWVEEKLGGAPHSKQSLRLWLRMLTCTTMIEATIRNRLRQQFNTTLPRFDVLAALDRVPEGLTMGELSHWLMVSNGNVTGVVNRLEADGLITRYPSPRDKRTHYVKLTRKGQAEFDRMAAAHEEWIDELFAEIGNEDAAVLMDHLDRLRKNLTERQPGKERK